MRLWFVSELYYPQETSTGYVLTRLAERLARTRDVAVLSAQPPYVTRDGRAPWSERRGGVAITRCWSTTFNKDHLAGRLLNLVTVSASIFITALRRLRRGDVVIVVTNPPLLPYIVLVVCKLRRCGYVLLVHDVYPEVLYAAGILRRGSLISRVCEAVASLPYNMADRVVVLARDMAALVAPKLGPSRHKPLLITNWADLDDVAPMDRHANAILEKLNLRERVVVQYSGNMGRTHGLGDVLTAIKRLRDIAPDVHFLFAGSGAYRETLREAAATGTNNLTVIDTRPRADLQTLLNAADVALVCMGPGMAGISVPSRMYNILAAGVPIIAVADEASELARVVIEERVGWLVPPGRVDLLIEAILKARQDLASDTSYRSRARRAAEKYTLDAATRAYDQMLGEVTSRRRAPVLQSEPSPHSVDTSL